jgi:hypothetical protein
MRIRMHWRLHIQSVTGIHAGNIVSEWRQDWRTHHKNSRVCLHLLIDRLPVEDDGRSSCKVAALYDGQNMYCLLQVGAGRMVVVWYLSVSHMAFSFFAAAAMVDRRAEGPTMEGAGSAMRKRYPSTSGIGGDLEGWLTRSGTVLLRTGPHSVLPMDCCMLGG